MGGQNKNNTGSQGAASSASAPSAVDGKESHEKYLARRTDELEAYAAELQDRAKKLEERQAGLVAELEKKGKEVAAAKTQIESERDSLLKQLADREKQLDERAMALSRASVPLDISDPIAQIKGRIVDLVRKRMIDLQPDAINERMALSNQPDMRPLWEAMAVEFALPPDTLWSQRDGIPSIHEAAMFLARILYETLLATFKPSGIKGPTKKEIMDAMEQLNSYSIGRAATVQGVLDAKSPTANEVNEAVIALRSFSDINRDASMTLSAALEVQGKLTAPAKV